MDFLRFGGRGRDGFAIQVICRFHKAIKEGIRYTIFLFIREISAYESVHLLHHVQGLGKVVIEKCGFYRAERFFSTRFNLPGVQIT